MAGVGDDMLRPKSVASSMGIPVKTLYDWKLEQRFKEEEENRVGATSSD